MKLDHLTCLKYKHPGRKSKSEPLPTLQPGFEQLTPFVFDRGELIPLAVATMAHLDWSFENSAVCFLLPIRSVDIFPFALADVELSGTPDLDACRNQHLLTPMGEPANTSGYGEKNRVEAVKTLAMIMKRVVWCASLTRGGSPSPGRSSPSKSQRWGTGFCCA